MPEKERPSYWLPVEHSMLRRNNQNNYHREGKAYMVTLRIEGMVPLLGTMVRSGDTGNVATCRNTEPIGRNANRNTEPIDRNANRDAAAQGGNANRDAAAEGGNANRDAAAEEGNAARIAECRLTVLGEAMRQAWVTLPQRFNNISVIDSPEEYVIMPEHFHGIIYVTGYMQEHLSDVIKLFKSRVAMVYRKLLAESIVPPSTAPINQAGNAGTTPVPIRAVGTAKEWLKVYMAQSVSQQEAMRQWIDGQIAALFAPAEMRSATSRRIEGAGMGGGGADGGVSNGGGSNGGADGGGSNGSADGGISNGGGADGGADGGGSNGGGGAPPFKVVASGSHSKVGFLFGVSYNDGVLLDDEDLDGHRRYIYYNPHSRWMRTHAPERLKTNRNGIDTAVTIPALEGYLRRECPPRDVTEDKLAAVRGMLLYSATCRRIECHSYGDRALLERQLFPVVCHRRDLPHFDKQMARCLEEARAGAVMVSACISRKEREIIDAVMAAGYPVVRIKDNGFPDMYHPSEGDIDLCNANRLLLVTPWQYHYRHKDEAIYVAYCKTMNCIAQALCRQKDSWWS